MSKSFQPFQWGGDKVQAEQAKNFNSPEFSVATAQSVSNVAYNIKDPKFTLDPKVYSAIGVAEEEESRKEKRIQEELERRWEVLKAKAEVEGFQAGLEQGKKDAYLAEIPRIEEQLQRLNSIVGELTEARLAIYQANERFLMELIAVVCKAVLLKEIELDESYLKRVVADVLTQTNEKEDIRILISDKDKILLEGLQLFIEKEFGKLRNSVIETSPDMAKGSCRVETRFGVVDASVEKQIQNIVQTLRNA